MATKKKTTTEEDNGLFPNVDYNEKFKGKNALERIAAVEGVRDLGYNPYTTVGYTNALYQDLLNNNVVAAPSAKKATDPNAGLALESIHYPESSANEWWANNIIPDSADPMMASKKSAWYYNDIIPDSADPMLSGNPPTNRIDNPVTQQTAMPPRPDFLDEPDMGLTLSEYQQENPMMIGVGRGNPYDTYFTDTSNEFADPILNGGIANPGDGSWAGLTPEQKQILAGFIPSTDKGDDDDEDDDDKDRGGQLPTYTPSQYVPTQYSSAWSDRLNAIINDLNLDKFKFDLNGEELYQQYKDQYLRNGRLAMMDTMGQAAGLTGGYGSTYSQNAGQQAYQGYVNELNNVVPDVYNAAYTRWRDSISDKLRQYELMANADERDYSRWADAENANYNRWYNDEKMRYDAYSDAQNLATKERIAQMEADQKAAENERKVYNDTWEAAYKAGTGEAIIGPNGERLFANTGVTKNPDGTYTYSGGTSGGTEISGVPDTEIATAVAQAYKRLIGNSNPSQVPQRMQAVLDQLKEENGWDIKQTAYAKQVLLAMME